MKKFMMTLGCVGLCSAAALADKVPTLVQGGTLLTPLRVAQMNADGTHGEWMNYVSPENPPCPGPVLMEFADLDWDLNDDGFCDDPAPADSTPCGLGSSRWYFGSAYVNPFAMNDMSGAGTADVDNYTMSWYWGGGNCVVIISTYDSDAIAVDPGDCSSTPIQQTDASFLGGVIFDFGPIAGPSGYYFSAIDSVCTGFAICTPMPADGIGAYSMILASYTDTDPATLFLNTAPGTQPMLWGVHPGSVATSGPVQYDDDFPTDGLHSAGSECYTYAFGICPDPLGSCVGLWAARGNACAEDCSGDGFRDQADLALLLSCYNGGPCCDIDGDGDTDQADLAALLAVYNVPC